MCDMFSQPESAKLGLHETRHFKFLRSETVNPAHINVRSHLTATLHADLGKMCSGSWNCAQKDKGLVKIAGERPCRCLGVGLLSAAFVFVA